jgi:hypothetical protein
MILRPPPRDDGGRGVGGIGGVPSSISGGAGEGGDDDGGEGNVSDVVTTTSPTLPQLSDAEWERRTVLFEFMGNLDILSNFVNAMGFAPSPPLLLASI